MENASKALLIAGGVFVAIVILVIAVELFVGYRNVAETYDETMTMSEISKINKEFTKYIGRDDITIQEVATAIRTAQNYNEKYGDNTIIVFLGSTNETDRKNEDFPGLIKDNIDNLYKFEIDDYYDETDINQGLVHKIKFY